MSQRRPSPAANPATVLRRLGVVLCGLAAIGLGGSALAARGKKKPPPTPIEGETIEARERPRMDVVFVLDSTGSMWDELATAKAETLRMLDIYAAEDAELRIGVVTYRDKGDVYRVKALDFTYSMEDARRFVRELRAGGGGDRKESVNFGLKVAIHNMEWDSDKNTAKSIVLLGDSPPHVYTGEPSYGELCGDARVKDIVINTVALGPDEETEKVFRKIAELGGGAFEHVDTPKREDGSPEMDEFAPRLDVVFVIDTTGSMGSFVEEVKRKVHAIKEDLTVGQPAPAVRFGVVEFRDKGDSYRTRPFSLTYDMESFLYFLDSLHASGGGDWKESVNKGLEVAIRGMKWDKAEYTERIVILVGDAPPHSYPGEADYTDLAREAKAKEITVHTIACREDPELVAVWTYLAKETGGGFHRLGSTTMDKAIDDAMKSGDRPTPAPAP